MIRAYDEGYLDDAMKCLGEAMDYAANSCEIKMDSFDDSEQRYGADISEYAISLAAGILFHPNRNAHLHAERIRFHHKASSKSGTQA